MARAMACLVIGAVLGMQSACLPPVLDKYRKKPQAEPQDALLPRTAGDGAPAPAPAPEAKQAPVRASIYALDQNTFRFVIKEPEVWDSALAVLMRNYNVTIIDKVSGIITTEWDSYYLDKEVFRNRISMRLVRQGRDFVDVTIYNNVERLRDASSATASHGAVWLPSEDHAHEVERIVQNMASTLGQPPPALGMQASRFASKQGQDASLR